MASYENRGVTMSIILSAGHTPSSWGASGVNGLREHNVAREYTQALFEALVSRGVPSWVLPWDMSLSGKIQLVNFTFPKGIALDIHLNAFNKKATGAEMFYRAGDLRGFTLGKAILEEHCRISGLKNRGMKLAAMSARGSLGWTSRLSSGILMELCFMDNPEDMQRMPKPMEWASGISGAIASVLDKEK